jgi:hypothetical protein
MLANLLSRPVLRASRGLQATTTAAEVLEDRVVLSAHGVAAAVDATIDAIDVNDVRFEDGTLVANITVSGTVGGHAFAEMVDVPLDINSLEILDGENGECALLNLSLGPVYLDVLGLQVALDDCNGGPITLDITAVEGEGNLLGNLLCSVAHLLDDGGLLGDNGELLGNLGDLLGELDLTEPELLDLQNQLTDALTQLLDAVFADFLANANGENGNGDGNGNGNGPGQGRGRTTTLLDLRLGEGEETGLRLDLLGLLVETSPICLEVRAERGAGNLLGNLLAGVAHLADRDPGNAVNALLDRIDRILATLDDDLLGGGNQGQGRGQGPPPGRGR